MHILVTNDDGPPSATSSPYVHSLVRELQKAGHTVSVCLPHTQRSWIGKAHMIGQTVKPLYYRPPATFDPSPSAAQKTQGTTYTRPIHERRRLRQVDAERNGEENNKKEGDEEEDEEEWILVDGTPASCAQIGLHHFFQDRGAVDLVVSGPNYGRNTTAVFALSSGTLGGALEAAVCRRKAVALSYAFSTRNHDPAVIGAASRHSVRVIERLHAQWPAGGEVDLYSVNVPLVEGVGARKTLWAPMLQNYWGCADGDGGSGGACFQEVEGSVGDGDEEEERIREDEEARAKPAAAAGDDGGGGAGGGASNGDAVAAAAAAVEKKANAARPPPHRHFKWAPRFADVYKSVEDSPPGNDGWAVKEGFTSVTPMKANFWHSATHLHGEELILDNPKSETSTTAKYVAASESTLTMALRPKHHFYALIAYEDAYVQPLILSALQKLFPPESYTLLSPPPPPTSSKTKPASAGETKGYDEDDDDDGVISLPRLLPPNHPDAPVLQVTPYEAIDWEYAAAHPRSCLINSYMLRKALIRKHYLAATVEHWVAKRPRSALGAHVKRTEAFELDYAEFLDDALVEAFDLRASLERNARACGEGESEGGEIEWWILKPSMSDRGQGIRIFSTMEELQGIFDAWEGSEDEEEEEDDDDDDDDDDDGKEKKGTGNNSGRDYITTSHLRHFVAQPYIHPPLLLPAAGNRKFHIRTYVACVGALDVYVYRPMLALFAAKPYAAPGSLSGSGPASPVDLEAHLTNTCLQRSVASGTVRRFWDLAMPASLFQPRSEGLGDGDGDGDADADAREHIFAQVGAVAADLFEAAARGNTAAHFRPLANAFEAFGLDFVVDARGAAWLLEVNAFPDFAQTGADPELRALVAGFWHEVLRVAVGGFFGGGGGGGGQGEGKGKGEGEGEGKGEGGLVLVRRVDLGRQGR